MDTVPWSAQSQLQSRRRGTGAKLPHSKASRVGWLRRPEGGKMPGIRQKWENEI